MLRRFPTLLLPAMFLAFWPAPADAQWRARPLDPVAGAYVNTTNNGTCYVQPWGSGYVFTNENGSQAQFEFVAPRQLQNVSGEWEPDMIATVQRGRLGRTAIRFDSPRNPPGYWVRVN